MGFHGVRPRSLWVVIAPSPGEIRGRVLRVKGWGNTTTICVPSFEVIEEAVHRDGGWPFFTWVLYAKTGNFPTKILTIFLNVLSYKFFQSRSNLSF